MALRIFLLGQFKLQAGDQPLELPARRAQSLLAYLALNAGMAHRREKLAGLLWPDATEKNARSYLRQALWRIHKALESASLPWEQYLQISDISIAFDDRSGCWLDTDLFLESGQTETIAEMITAINLYRGELLPGFYDEWIVLERDRLQAAYQQRMNRLLLSLLEREQWDDAVQWSEQWIRLGFSPEGAYRALLRAYAGLGDRGMVNATYQRCVDAIERELELPPDPETERLYMSIVGGEMSEPTAQPASPVALAANQPLFLAEGESQHPEKPLFVARERELAQLDDALNHTLSGQGRVIFVTGEAGSGKTALIQEFTQRIQEIHPDLIVAGGNCNAHTGIGDPYLPFREVLEWLTGDVEARWAAAALSREHALRLWHTLPRAAQAVVDAGPDLVDTFIPGAALIGRVRAAAPGEVDWVTRLANIVERKASSPAFQIPQQSDLFEQVTRMLQLLARTTPMVLVIDDLQWADLGSISLLFHLGRNLAGSRILIIGAYRSEEVAIGRAGDRHPLASVVSEFQRLSGEIVVNLDQAERRDFVEAILDSEPNNLDLAFRQMLFKQTRGHPLFTIELLTGLQERGDLVLDDKSQWIAGPALDWEKMPARVEAVVAERINRLPQPLRATLRAASVEGERFTAEVVAEIRGTGEHEMLDCLSGELNRRHRLVRAHSITRMDGRLLSKYRFRHIQIQKYLYGCLDEVERVYLHERFGGILEKLYGGQAESAAIAIQLARHYQEAGITEKAVHYLYQAGERAMQMSAYMEANAHLSRGLVLLAALPDSHERAKQELALQLTLGAAWLSMGIPAAEMETAYERARDLCIEIGEMTQLCSALGGLAILNFMRSQNPVALEFAEEAMRLARQSGIPLLLLLSHWYLGIVLFALGEYTEAREQFALTIDSYDPQLHHHALVQLRGVDGGVSAIAYDACCLWCLGYPDQALQRSQEALSLARELDHPFSLEDVLCYGGCILDSMRRDGSSLENNAAEMIRLANENGFTGWLKMGTCLRGEGLVLLGQTQDGIDLMCQSITAKIASGEWINLPGILCFLAETYLQIGHIEEAQESLAAAFEYLDGGGERLWEAEYYRVQGELPSAQDDEDRARASFEKAIEVARRQSAKSWELRATIGLARLLHKQGRSDEAHQLLSTIYDWFTEGFDTKDLREARALLVELS